MSNLYAKFAALKKQVAGNREHMGYEFSFGMTREELDQVMEPKLYIGRCEQQVLRFLDECAPLLRDAAAEDGAIDL